MSLCDGGGIQRQKADTTIFEYTRGLTIGGNPVGHAPRARREPQCSEGSPVGSKRLGKQTYMKNKMKRWS